MRLGILTDIHEDIYSLRTAMDIFSKNICDELVCLGDILGCDPNIYKKIKKRDASECISIIKENFKYVVIGNHDLFAIKKLPNRTNAYNYPNYWYELSIEERRELSQGKLWLYEHEKLLHPLKNSEIEFVYSLPEQIIVKSNTAKAMFSHSILPDITGSHFFKLHNPWELNYHFTFMKSNEIQFGFCGHAHPDYLTIATNQKINTISYKKANMIKDLSQYLCPPLVNGSWKSGLIIADIENGTIEAIEINNVFKNIVTSIYGRK